MSSTAVKVKDHQQASTAGPFDIKVSHYHLPVLKISDGIDDLFWAKLQQKISQAPQFFKNTPVVLDLTNLDDRDFDLRGFIQKLRHYHLYPSGILTDFPYYIEVAKNLFLPVFPQGKIDESLDLNKAVKDIPKPEKITSIQPAPSSLTLTNPIRSGDQIYHDGDITALAPIGAGSEIVATGSVHIYSSLRGRVLAGVKGDETQRIFCKSLEAELISVAGIYTVSENIPKEYHKASVQIYLEDGNLIIDHI